MALFGDVLLLEASSHCLLILQECSWPHSVSDYGNDNNYKNEHILSFSSAWGMST